MELAGELFLTASLALFLSFLVAKLVVMAMACDVAAGHDSGIKSGAIADDEGVFEVERHEESLRVQGFGSETRVESVEEALYKEVDRLHHHHREEDLGLGERSETVGLLGTIVSEGEVEKVLFEFDARGVNGGCAGDSVEDSSENVGVEDETGVESVTNDVVSPSSGPEEVGVVGGELEGKDEANEVGLRGIGDDDDVEDDDWEGIERNELEKDFAAAVKFVESGAEDGGGRFAEAGRDVQMELYGLRKVATEGPCHEAQPLAHDLAAQAKWNSWQRLGNLRPEMAMEQYITILSDKVPGWMEDHFAGEDKQKSSKEEMPNTVAADFSTLLHHPQSSTNEREQELESGAEPVRVDFTGAPDLENKATG
ncbi:Acyl-CoA-binding protein, ACBP [Parasponia andersonii]|uniref:Acyl-CoA-binding protein, ACBP n=1 Tax=Parasponia andersonii TaxID=3476 RepID=A0A2P5BZN7_PARAD|nr:Acyl-CoA-binding protein, ACBP [Parasponia andersonii]